jgi:tripartite-type tricarboxylate transporter receptor subunit TctC
VGSLGHLMAAAFVAVAGVDAVHVPYKGGIEMNRAVVRGDVEFAFNGLNTALPLLSTQQLRPIAVTSEARVPQLPDVPTLRETVKSDLMVQESWAGLWAPARTPAEIVRRIHSALGRTVSDPELRREAETRFGATSSLSTSPEEFDSFLRREDEKWAKVVKITGARAD